MSPCWKDGPRTNNRQLLFCKIFCCQFACIVFFVQTYSKKIMQIQWFKKYFKVRRIQYAIFVSRRRRRLFSSAAAAIGLWHQKVMRTAHSQERKKKQSFSTHFPLQSANCHIEEKLGWAWENTSTPKGNSEWENRIEKKS